ncbi:hypothetical protein U0070_010526 [Myodes glareolus]|uniref:Glycosylation-dependent cell adhesion molecule 1 n=1 Tax=Myodes glareolus TaxID=447135 RepID=A0AAW0I5N2_MYOGA
MNFFTVLLFASLAITSLAVLPASQSTPTSPISKESTSSNDSFKEPSIIREESVSKDNVVIKCTKSKSEKAQARLRSGASQLEETIGPITSTGPILYSLAFTSSEFP